MTLILDAGALIAVERGQREVVALLKLERLSGRVPLTHGGVIGQVWRDGRQARLAALLPALEIQPLDAVLGRRAGALLAASKTSDVIDAALVLLAVDGDTVLTSDASDLRRLARSASVDVDIVAV